MLTRGACSWGAQNNDRKSIREKKSKIEERSETTPIEQE